MSIGFHIVKFGHELTLRIAIKVLPILSVKVLSIQGLHGADGFLWIAFQHEIASEKPLEYAVEYFFAMDGSTYYLFQGYRVGSI